MNSPELDLDKMALDNAYARALAQRTFIDYIYTVAPFMIIEEAHILIAAYLQAVNDGKIDRLMIFMPPRSGKTQIGTILFPSWYLGQNPALKILAATYKDELSTEFGREMKNIILGEDYQRIFPGVELVKDSKAAGRWKIKHPEYEKEGHFFGAGIRSGIAGRGFHLGIIDDALSEHDAQNKKAKDFVYNWYGPGFYTRRQMEERSMIVMFTTRWATDDLAGRLLRDAAKDPSKDQWTVLSIPALLEDQSQADRLNQLRNHPLLTTKLKRANGEAYSYKKDQSSLPRRIPTKEFLRIKATLGDKDFASLYQQRPVEEGGHILSRDKWRKWPDSKPPKLEFVMQVYDTAFSDKEQENRSYTARTTWGVFLYTDQDIGTRHHVILLEGMKGRLSFPDLRKMSHKSYTAMKPERVLIENKASGLSLIQEMRRKGVPVKTLPASRDKVARAHAASVVLDQRCVWYMEELIDEGKNEYQLDAEEIIETCSNFPFVEFDDVVDTVTHAWIYLRKTFWLNLNDEKEEEEVKVKSQFRGYGN